VRAANPAALAAELAPASRWLLVLDFDGTLSPIVEHPDDARPAPGALDAIRSLAARTSVAVVSGRPVAQLRDRLGDLPVTFAGGHGAEVVAPDGTSTSLVDDPDGVRRTLDAAEAAVGALVDTDAGWVVERKDASLAVHHRRVDPPLRDRLLPQVLDTLHEARDRPEPDGFEVLEGKAVVELRPAGVDKGRALAWIVDHLDTRPPLVIGDDVTDEDAFAEAARHGGASVLVAEHPRGTVARWRLHTPDEVVRFLAALAATDTEGPDRG
jgi:trehalose-phosphatase